MSPFVTNCAYFLVAVLLSKGMGMFQSFLMAKALGPTDFGIWVTIILLIGYTPIVSMGTVETMLKKVPYYRGRNDLQRVKRIEAGVMGSAVLSCVLFLAIAFLAPIVLNASALRVHLPLLIMTLIAVAISYFTGFFYYRFACYENFKATGIIDFMRAVVALLFIGGMGWTWGLKGAVAGYLIHEVITCSFTVFVCIRSHGMVGVSFQQTELFEIIRIGFPITIVWWVLILQNSVDRVVLGRMLGPTAVGHYGLGMSIASTLALVPMVVGRVLYPKVNRQFGAADPDLMRSLVIGPTVMLGVLFANMQLLTLSVMPVLYNNLLPKYHPGLHAGQILVLGCFSACMLRNGANYLVAANKQFLFLKYVLVCLAVTAAADVIPLRIGWGIEGVALGTSLAAGTLYILVWRRVAQDMGFHGLSAWKQIGAMYLPLLVLAASVTGVRYFFGNKIESVSLFSLAMLGMQFAFLNGTLLCIPAYRNTMAAALRILAAHKTLSQKLLPA